MEVTRQKNGVDDDCITVRLSRLGKVIAIIISITTTIVIPTIAGLLTAGMYWARMESKIETFVPRSELERTFLSLDDAEEIIQLRTTQVDKLNENLRVLNENQIILDANQRAIMQKLNVQDSGTPTKLIPYREIPDIRLGMAERGVQIPSNKERSR